MCRPALQLPALLDSAVSSLEGNQAEEIAMKYFPNNSTMHSLCRLSTHNITLFSQRLVAQRHASDNHRGKSKVAEALKPLPLFSIPHNTFSKFCPPEIFKMGKPFLFKTLKFKNRPSPMFIA